MDAEARMDGGGSGADRQPHTFVLDHTLVERARREVGEPDVVRSIEAALVAALDYRAWVRAVREGRRDVLG
ncbi:MAG: hypothetical protein GWM90_04730 [Gemmatimonadetes bacterium]|nr:hypothetical protein [Gemmatimonadota bacterium]NIQ53009.1 hypothetical protein [Gemmatimonadota bacterium]NIU73153.1 hypothetical protein [Gammaproteobacteria bacterium]NIX43447.1 hypothetical protein [Gemmatimonadota bacterium]NIY07623.1 hypothetical protein [Gemmatimonadota bacterium]